MKKIMVAVVAGVSLYQMPVVLAGPVNVTGDVSIKYERDTADDSAAKSGMIYTTKIMGETDFGAGWSGYVRLGAQHVTQSSINDFNSTGGYDPNKKSLIALDQFGVVYKADKLTYKLGRQDVAVGPAALLYSRPDSNIGKKSFVDGLSISGTVGVMDISAVAVQEDNANTFDNKVYAIRTGYNPRENLNWGLTLGHYQGTNVESTNHWGVDGTYTVGKSSLTAEFTKSSSSTDNKAYAAILNYKFDDKTSASITNFRVEENGSMGQQSDFDFDNHGFHYGITHNLSKADHLEVVYKAQKTISGGVRNNVLEATLSHVF